MYTVCFFWFSRFSSSAGLFLFVSVAVEWGVGFSLSPSPSPIEAVSSDVVCYSSRAVAGPVDECGLVSFCRGVVDRGHRCLCIFGFVSRSLV